MSTSHDHHQPGGIGRPTVCGARLTAPVDPRIVDVDVSWMVPADLCGVEVLARLQLIALRRGCWLELHGVGGGLAELLEFCGLGDVVHVCRSCPPGDPDPETSST